MTNLGDFAQSRGDVMRRLRELEQQVQRMRAERRLEHATIGRGGIRIKGGHLRVEENGDIVITGGGGLTVEGGGGVNIEDGGEINVRDGGDIRVRYPDGDDDAVYMGDIFTNDGNGPYEGTGLLVEQSGVAGAQIDIIRARYNPETESAIVQVSDVHGKSILRADDDRSGPGGLLWPWLAFGMVPARYTDWPSTTSGTFETVWSGYLPRANPSIYLDVRHTSDVSGTTGEVRVRAAGSTIGTTAAVGFVIAQHEVNVQSPGAHGESVFVEIQLRRTAGTGKVMCAPYMSTGLGS